MEPRNLIQNVVDGRKVSDQARFLLLFILQKFMDFGTPESLGVGLALFLNLPGFFELIMEILLVF